MAILTTMRVIFKPQKHISDDAAWLLIVFIAAVVCTTLVAAINSKIMLNLKAIEWTRKKTKKKKKNAFKT